MLRDVIGCVNKVDYMVFEIDKDVDGEVFLNSKGYDVREMSPDNYIQLVDDEYYMWMDSKHYYWNLSKQEEPMFDAMDNGLSNFKMLLEGYRVISVNSIDNPNISVDIPLTVDGGYGYGFGDGISRIVLRGDLVEQLGFESLKKLMSDLRDVATIPRMDLVKDYYYRDKNKLTEQMNLIRGDYIGKYSGVEKDDGVGYFGEKNKNKPITFTGFVSGLSNYASPTYYIGDQNDVVNLKFYNPIKYGHSKLEDMLTRLKLYNEKVSGKFNYLDYDVKDELETFEWEIENALSKYVNRFFDQFIILRVDLTLTNELANKAGRYILGSLDTEEVIVGHLLQETSDNYLGL